MAWNSMITFTAGALALGVATGCSSDGLVTSTGTVSYDGQRLSAGAVSFHPFDKSITPQGGQIVGGRFRIRCRPGRQRVEIIASRPKAGAEELTPGMTPSEQFIPARYNDESTLEVEVLATGPNDFTFDLESKPFANPNSDARQ